MDLAHLVLAGLVSARRGVRRWLQAPALHFAIIGAVLFALSGAGGGRPGSQARAREPIVVTAPQIERLLAAHAQATGLQPSVFDARVLVDREIDEEVLYREAIVLGLEAGDRGVQWRLIEKMTFLSDDVEPDREDLLSAAVDLGLGHEDPVVRRILVEKMRLGLKHAGSARVPAPAELESYLERHRERFLQPPRFRISQIFLGRDRHPGSLERDAAQLLDELRRGAVAPEQATTRGDSLPLDALATSLTVRDLAARFGPALADAVPALAPGVWSEPLPSAFGLHLVWVHEQVPARLPALAEVRSAVLYGLMAERRDEALAANLRALRSLYDVRIEWPRSLATASTGGTP